MKTQKALGIFNGIQRFFREELSIKNFLKTLDHRELLVCGFVSPSIDTLNYPVFARPCPMIPRHGFVESRVVNNPAEARALIKEVLEQDPDGELICGPCLTDIRSSAVYVSSGLLSIGDGNDGATAGKNSTSFPVASNKFSKELYAHAAIKDKAIYFETLHGDFQNYLVQVRGGPEVSGVIKDFIPEKVAVKKVVFPTNDLLAWEKQVKTFAKGTVVYGKGFTLASHAAIHCVINDIPFITSKVPKVGSVLSSTEDVKASISRASFRKGVLAALKRQTVLEYSSASNKDMQFCLSVLHNWSYLKRSKHAGWLLGAATTLFMKICTALVCGEYRHVDGYKSGRAYRSIVYRDALCDPIKHANGLWKKCKAFYSQCWDDAVGGVPWAMCAWYTASIWESIAKSYNGKGLNVSNKEVSKIMGLMNRTVNLEHNECWWFDKIMNMESLDFVAEMPGVSALCVADVFHDFWKATSKSKKNCKINVPKKERLPFGVDGNGKLTIALAHCEEWTDSELHNTHYDYSGEIWKEGIGWTSEFNVTSKDCNNSRKTIIPLKVVSGKGFQLPGGRIIPLKKIKVPK